MRRLRAQRQHRLLSGWNEGKPKKQKIQFQKTRVGACTSFGEHQQPSIRHFQQEPVCRNVSLPGSAPVDGCQDILCVVNRRLHYAGAVWVVNQCACLGRLQGNVEHLRKAAGLLPTKVGSWIGQGPAESRVQHLSLFNYCQMRIHRDFFCLFLWSNRMGRTPRNREQSEPKNHKTAQIFLPVMKQHRFPHEGPKGFII